MGETEYRPLTFLQRVRGGQQSGQDLAHCFQAEDTDMPISIFPVEVAIPVNLLEERIRL